MNIRTIAVCLAASAALVAAGCGDDDDDAKKDTGGTTTEQQASAEGGEIKDVEPRSAKPNLVGGDAPIADFATTIANDAIAYWEGVFQNSQLPYNKPAVTVLTAPGDNGCGNQLDPAKQPFFLCASPQGSKITLGGPVLDQIRTSNGDGAVAFLAGFGVALDTNDQLSGGPIANGQQVDDVFIQRAGCFTGAWVRNLADKQILQQGDDAEVLSLAGQFVPGSSAEISKSLVALGFNEGAQACQQKIGGDGGGGGTETQPEPAPAPSE